MSAGFPSGNGWGNPQFGTHSAQPSQSPHDPQMQGGQSSFQQPQPSQPQPQQQPPHQAPQPQPQQQTHFDPIFGQGPSAQDVSPGEAPGAGAAHTPTLREQFESQGIDVSKYSDEDLFNTMSHALTQIQRIPDLERMAQYGQRYLQYAPKIEELEKQGQQPQQPQQPEEPGWKPPEVNYNAYSLAEQDPQTGLWKPKAGYEGLISPVEIDRLNQYDRWIREQTREFWTQGPPNYIWEKGLKENVAKLVNDSIEQRLSQALADQQADDFIVKNANQFFQMDQNGQFVIGADGQPVRTQRGQVFEYFVDEAKQRFGIQDRLGQQQYAAQQLAGFEAQQALRYGQQQQLAQQPVQQPPQQVAGQPPAFPQQSTELGGEDDFYPSPEQLAGQGEPGQSRRSPQTSQPPFQQQQPQQFPQPQMGISPQEQRRREFARSRGGQQASRSISAAAQTAIPEGDFASQSFATIAHQIARERGLYPQTG